MGTFMVRSDDARMVYNNAKAALATQGVDLAKAKLTPSYLRFETTLNQSATEYDFPIVITQANINQQQSPTEQRLQLQDSFYISHLSFFIQVYTSFTNSTLFRYIPFTFPSNLGNVDGAFGSYAAYKLWAGYLSLTINNDVILPQWDCYRHLVIPDGQNQAWANPWPTGQFFDAYDEYDGSQDAFYPMEPNIVLIGSKNNQLKLNFPESLGTSIGGGVTVIRACVVARGVLAQNSTTVR